MEKTKIIFEKTKISGLPFKVRMKEGKKSSDFMIRVYQASFFFMDMILS